MNSVFVRIQPGQEELAVRLVQPGCGSQVISREDMRLVITAPQPKSALLSEQTFTGFWPGSETPWSDAVGAGRDFMLVYPAFDVNEEGDVVFRFDDQLRTLRPGRYIGSVETASGTQLVSLDIDLSPTPLLIETLTLTGKSCA